MVLRVITPNPDASGAGRTNIVHITPANASAKTATTSINTGFILTGITTACRHSANQVPLLIVEVHHCERLSWRQFPFLPLLQQLRCKRYVNCQGLNADVVDGSLAAQNRRHVG